jgi:ATP-dependent Clp protease ATP-binding subunit ClpC
MTSNVGAELIWRQDQLGFDLRHDEDTEERQEYEKMQKKLTEALKKAFRPEFLNRVDSIMIFHALTRSQIAEIVDLELAKVALRLNEHEITIQTTDEARALLADLGYDPEMGARPLRRVIQNKVENQLSDALLAGDFKHGDAVLIDVADDEIVLKEGDPEIKDEAQEPLPTA